jgi:hypothetical protein
MGKQWPKCAQPAGMIHPPGERRDQPVQAMRGIGECGDKWFRDQ